MDCTHMILEDRPPIIRAKNVAKAILYLYQCMKLKGNTIFHERLSISNKQKMDESSRGHFQLLSQEVTKALPNLKEDALTQVLDKLVEVGVEQVADMQLLQESDLFGILKPIQIRKLLGSRNNTGSSQESTVGEATLPDSQPRTPKPSKLPSDKRCSDLAWPMEIEIPLDKVPEVRSSLEAGQRPSCDIRRSLVRTIVDVVRLKTHHATKQQMACVAQRIVNRYPNSLQDRIGSVLVGSGFDSLSKQLTSRNENLNRKSLSPFCVSAKKHSLSQIGIPTASSSSNEKKKKTKTDSYGCANWNPSVDPEDIERLSKIKCHLKEMSTSPQSTIKSDEIKHLMEETFPLQRNMINEGASVSKIMMEWPFLANESVLLAHVNELLGFDLMAAVANAYLTKAPRLNKYFASGLTGKSDLLQGYFEEAKEQGNMENIQSLLQAVVLGVLACLGENESALFLVVDEMSTKEDVEKINVENWPRLAMLGDSVLAAKQFMLLVDGEVILDSTSFVTSLSALFGSYYIFNIEYPKAAEATLEFLQRCFVNLNPDNGSGCKAKKKKASSVNSKVLKLINAIADFEWTSQ